MSADFTPEKEDYKILTPFKMQVLTNFPYIEADFDALTNYGLLCKVVEYLNNVIANENEVTEQVTSLYNAYVSLQAYVNQEIGDFESTVNNRVDGLESYMNNYFNNLDVQQEINNKLDAMAEDGTLTTLISGYVDPIYQAYETEITGRVNDQDTTISAFETLISSTVGDIQTQVNSISSGSPKGVYATASDLSTADPDHDYIYLVTADGKWYYYDTNTTSWTAGGTYQSTGVPETIKKGTDFYNFAIPADKLDLYNFNDNLLDTSKLISGWIYNNGIVQPSTTVSTSDYIPVDPGDVLKLGYYLNGNPTPQTAINTWCTFDDEYNLTGHYSTTNETSITVPADSKYVRVSIANTVLSADVMLYKNSDTMPSYVPYNITIKDKYIPTITSKLLIVDVNDTTGKYYKSINAALAGSSDGDIIFVMPGEYNEVVSFASKNITIIGADREKVILYNSTGLYANTPMYISGNVTVSNMTVKMLGNATQEQKGYALHIDRIGAGILTFNNCTFYNRVGAALGAGGQLNQFSYFYNCKFISDVDATDGQADSGFAYYGAMFFHAPTIAGRENNKPSAVFKECEFYSPLNRVITLSSSQDIEPLQLTFINCNLYSKTHKHNNVVYYNETTYLTISDESYGNSTSELN